MFQPQGSLNDRVLSVSSEKTSGRNCWRRSGAFSYQSDDDLQKTGTGMVLLALSLPAGKKSLSPSSNDATFAARLGTSLISTTCSCYLLLYAVVVVSSCFLKNNELKKQNTSTRNRSA